MKQHITFEQLADLPQEGLSKLQDYVNRDHITKKPHPKNDQWSVNPLQVDIGFMIEFLYEHNDAEDEYISFSQESFQGEDWWIIPERLCDDLWEAVKEVLND